MALGLFFERNTGICRKCPVKCKSVKPAGELPGHIVHWGAMDSRGKMIGLDTRARCVKNDRGAFSGRWTEQYVRQVQEEDMFDIYSSILAGMLNIVAEGGEAALETRLDTQDWVLIGMLGNMGSGFGEYSDLVSHWVLTRGLKIQSIRILEDGEE